MLNVRNYLPATEQYDSIVDTVQSDVSDLGEQAQAEGIPEEMIKPLENSEQTNEGDGVIHDIFQRQNKEEEADKEALANQDAQAEEDGLSGDDFTDTGGEEAGDGSAESSTDDEFATGDETGSDTVDDQAEQPEETSEETGDEPHSEEDEEEDDTEDLEVAVETYTTQLTNAGDTLSQQSAGFLAVGITDLQRRLNVTSVALESFEETPNGVRVTADPAVFAEQLKTLRSTLDTIKHP